MTTAAEVLNLAASQIGTGESPPNSNRTKYGAWYGLDGHPWCAMFVSWCFYHAGLPLPASTAKGFAYTPSGAAWFKNQNLWTTTPAPGHVVFYDFPGDGVNRISHVGIVERVNADGSITAIEGNTSSGASGSQRDGGGVYRRTRKVGIVGYGIPAFGGSAPPTPPPPPPPPPPPSTNPGTGWFSAAHPTVQQGSRGDAVKHLQQFLGIAADGIFGPNTRNAVINYQRSHGLSADGVAGPDTWSRIHPQVQQGAHGDRVVEVQHQVGTAPDGDFGPATHAAVQSFQRTKGLSADGIVGPMTYRAMF